MNLCKVGVLVNNDGITSVKTVVALVENEYEALERAKEVCSYGYSYGILEYGKAITID